MGTDTMDPAEQKAQLNEQLKDYISEWKSQRQKEEEELQKLKEKQAKRKEIRAEQEKKLNQQNKILKDETSHGIFRMFPRPCDLRVFLLKCRL